MARRAFCFTWNNFTTSNIEWSTLPAVTYAVWQHEKGQHEHLQGYVELNSPRRITYFKTLLPGAHWEVRQGSALQAKTYCEKLDTRVAGPWEYGVWSTKQPGKRNDLLELKDLLDQGRSEVEIMELEFTLWARNYKIIERYNLLQQAKRDWKPEVTVLIGKPGVGKSKYCMEQAPNAYWKENNKWWDGYCKHEDVIIDDFYGWLPWNTLLRLCDRYPMNLETKGGTVVCVVKRIFITSNTNLDQWYSNEKCDFAALKRRIDNYYEFEDGIIVNKSSLLT
ncbi:MAG: putative viral replication protein [Cressdnaviricota sp.]|nr:MAG: putative viral replication protein [Cressdnaviricota sp.]